MEPLDPELRQLIDDGLTAAAPDRDAESRGLESLLAHIEAPPVTPTVPAAPMLGKLALVIATVVTAGGTWIATRPAPTPAVDAPPPAKPPDPPEASPPTAAPVVAAPLPQQPTTPIAPVAPVDETPNVTPAEPRRAPRAPRQADAPAPTTADALRAEADLIAKAEAALDRGKPKQALALCDFHRDGFAAPQLATERNAIAASAACMVDRTDTGSGAAFVRAHPRSVLATKVRARCGLPRDEKTSSAQ